MGEETKKISFGFSKLTKKTLIISSRNKTQNTKPEDSDIEFIKGFESNSIQLKDPIKVTERVLVIPLKGPSSVIAATENTPPLDVLWLEEESEFDQKQQPCVPSNEPNDDGIGHNNDLVLHQGNLGGEIPQQEKLTLDELAAKEIIEDLNKDITAKSEAKVISVPLSSTSIGEKESSLDDYENVPVGDFGIAMLRGMGWTPGKGIGKNEKLVSPSTPLVRPKGMGLGADKVIKIPSNDKNKTDDDLKMSTGSFIRVIAGPNKDCYGQIEGFDDESGRAFVKLAMKNQTLSLNEFMFQLVDKSDFIKNSKVVNVGKYEQYKKAEESNQPFKPLESKSESRPKSPKLNKDTSSSHSSRSLSSGATSQSRHSLNRDKETKKDKASKSMTKYQRDSSSSSSGKSSTSSSSGYSRTKQRRKKKKPSSHRLKSRSRSRSPRKSNKHKKKR